MTDMTQQEQGDIHIELPKWIKLKKACINIRIKTQNASNIVFNP